MLGVSYKDRVRVQLFPPYKWIAEYHSSKFDATSTYSLEEVDGGTQMDVVTKVEFKAGSDRGGLAKWAIKRTIEKKNGMNIWELWKKRTEKDKVLLTSYTKRGLNWLGSKT